MKSFRPKTAMSSVQCLQINRNTLPIIAKYPASRIRGLKKFKYFTRWKPKFYDVPIELLDTYNNLAKWVYDHYGYGEFIVCFPDTRIQSKKFRKRFICNSLERAKCYRFKRERCKKWNNQKYVFVGMSCFRNKKITHGMSPRAYVTIEEGLNPITREPFVYHYNMAKMKMKMMFFWKGEERIDKRKELETPFGESVMEDRVKREL